MSAPPAFKPRVTCRACGGSFREVLALGPVPIVAFPGPEEPDPPSVPLTLVECIDCGLAQLKETTDPGLLWRGNYWYRSGTNPRMVEVLRDTVREIEARVGLQDGDVVIDTGSNDGTLLRQYQNPRLFTVGVEPSNIAKERASRTGVSLTINDFFGKVREQDKDHFQIGSTVLKRAKVITSIAMFYDLDNPGAFIEEVKGALAKGGLWVIQVVDLKQMLLNRAVDGICHEHVCYYNLTPLNSLLNRHGLTITEMQPVAINEGSMRLFVRRTEEWSKPPDHSITDRLVSEQKDFNYRMPNERGADPYTRFIHDVDALVREVRETIGRFVAEGKTVAAYGASTKGITLLALCGLTQKQISFAVERQPQKWGRVMPGTRIPIISEEEARLRRPDAMLVLPWTFAEEFIRREQQYLEQGGRLIIPLPTFRVVGPFTSPPQ